MESSGDESRCLLEKKKIPDIMRILTVLLDGGNQRKSVRRAIPSSIYMRQMSFTTEERTAILVKEERGSESITDHPNVRFRASPRIVVFQRFSPGNTYRVTLVVTNVSSVSQCLKVIGMVNPWLTLDRKDATCPRKLAPGMSVVYDVKFSPQDRRDCEDRVLFDTSTETFAVPVFAIGPRPLLDFPDVVQVPRTAVKLHSSKCLVVRNIGHAHAVFTLFTNRPFAVQPRKGILREGETIRITIDFLSNEEGCFEEKLFVVQETGEIVSLDLRGSAEPCAVRIERGTARMEETYLGLMRSKTFAIHNDSDYVSKFRWALYEDGERDRLEREKYETSFGTIKNIEVARKVDLEHYEICNPSIHEIACQRILADELSSLMRHTFPFRHPNYRLMPLEGKISPHSTVDVTLTFEPDEVGVIDGTAYLEITGCEERIRLNLQGTCVGPSMSLNVARADFGYIFLCSKHNCEVICGNRSEIPGTLAYSPRPSDCGGRIIVTPERLEFEPGEFKSFNLSFWSNCHGDFTETVSFVVEESLEVISLRVKGSVIRPTLHFDKQSLDFGVTALGFATKRDVGLRNSSLVPVTFGLTVMQDGTQPALTHEEFAQSMTKSTLASDPKEFTIVPDEGVVAPDSFQRIQVTYTPNVVKSSQTAIRAIMWDSDSGPITLPVTFNGKVASLVVRPSEILINFCFIDVPYTRTITIENRSDIEGYFYLPPQSVTVNTTVLYSLSLHQGYLKPYESRTISLKIIATALGRQKAQLSLHVFGERSVVACCSLICNGQGPVVTAQPMHLKWDQVRLLNELKAAIILSNDSPIPAQFNARLHKKLSPWTVRPSSGSLNPNESLELEVSVYLRDTGVYSDKVDIEIANGRIIACTLSAVGVGTSVALNPKMIPVFDMGLLFRNQDTSVPVTMTNKGTRHHRLVWTTAADFQVLQKNATYQQQRDKFSVDPHVVELPPDASAVVYCKIRWKAIESIEEQWYLHGQIKGQGKREVLGTSLFTAMFTDPKISFSERKLIFYPDTAVHDTKAQLTGTLCVTNRSGLDLSARVNIDPPFEIVPDEGDGGVESRTIALHDGVTARVCVKFNVQAVDPTNPHSRILQRTLTFDYGTHREQDRIDCVAEWSYPNLSGLPGAPLTLACEVGSTECKNLTLANTGDLPVHYHFECLGSNVGSATVSHDTMFLQRDAKTNDRSYVRDAFVTSGGRNSNGEEIGEEKEREEKRDVLESLSEQQPPKIATTVPAGSNGEMAIQSGIVGPETGRSMLRVGPMEDGRDLTGQISFGDRLALAVAEKDEPEDRFASIRLNDIRHFIFPIAERYIGEDMELALEPVFEDMRTTMAEGRREREKVTKILDVVPREGSVPPYSSQYIHFQFDGSQRAEIGAEVICRIKSGPSEIINVQAISDVIRYSVEKKHINFHRQLFFESCRETLTITNEGLVEFAFWAHRTPDPLTHADTSDGNGRTDETPDIDRLTIEPTHGLIHPASGTCLNINCYPGKPGPIRESFDLEIGHHAPISIHVEGYGSLPQTYLTIRRGETFGRLPVDVCYRAIGTLTAEFLIDVKSTIPVNRPMNASGEIAFDDDPALACDPIPKPEEERLMADGWELMSDAEALPTPVDIEMAVERWLAIEFIRPSPFILSGHDSSVTEGTIPSLFVPEYIIDLGYVVVEQAASCSTMLFNYGPAPVDVRLATERSERSPKHSGIVVRFCDRKSLPVGESTSLNVTFHPRQSRYSEKRTAVEYTFHLKVTHGASIPICLRAVATYPSLTAHTAHLAFGEVAVAHCLMMPILLHNDGWVPCRWEATIHCENACRSDKGNGPFFLRYSVDTFSPCHKDVVNVYFRPTEGKYFEGRLTVQVERSIFPVLVTLSGMGIEPALRLSEKSLTFEPTVPYHRPAVRTFLVKNVHSHPVEVFWRNFDTNFIEEDRVIRTLTHYYGVDELLFPPRQPGKKLSPIVYDFHQALIDEMKNVVASRMKDEENVEDRHRNVDGAEEGEEGKAKEKGGKGTKEDAEEFRQIGIKCDTGRTRPTRKRKVWPSVGYSFHHDRRTEKLSESLSEDPEQSEALLHLYIDKLREEESFLETMKDPMKEVFKDCETKVSSVDRSSPLRRLYIIFHGAPFTEYQRAACRLSKITNIPVLNITNAVLEAIAFGTSACSGRLREIVDENYYRLLASAAPYRERSNTDGPRTEIRPDHPRQLSAERTRDRNASVLETPGAAGYGGADTNAEANTVAAAIVVEPPADRDRRVEEDRRNGTGTHSVLFVKSDILDELNDTPLPEELGSMDPLDGYAYKIQTILLLQKIMATASTAREEASNEPERDRVLGTASRQSDNPGTKRLDAEDIFLGMDHHLIFAALKERLSMEDYRLGFTLQTLDNIFVKNERDILVMLLSIVGNLGELLFVTFYNTLNLYLNRNDELASDGETKAAQELETKLTALEEMTWAEYKNTSEDNKILYASNTLAGKKADSQRRRAIYDLNLLKAVTRRKIYSSSKPTSIAAIRMAWKGAVESFPSKFDVVELTRENRAILASGAEKMEGSYRKVKKTTPEELQEISRLMEMYQKSLATLHPVLANWDPDTCTYLETTAGDSTSKTDRARDTPQESAGSKGLDVWYVAPTDPWNDQLHDTVALYLLKIKDIENMEARGKCLSRSYPDSKLYYVATRKPASSSPLSVPNDAAYTLISATDPLAAAESNVSGNEGEMLQAGDATTEVRSRESRSTVSVSTIEESLKPRWIMQPDEALEFKVQFAPKSIGVHKYGYELSIVGSNVTHRIEIHGFADIPRLSTAPQDIFRKVKETKSYDINEPAYLLDAEVYDFGSMLLAAANEQRVHKRDARFYLTNISTLPAAVTVSRMDDSENFGVAPDLLDIAPRKTEVLDLWGGVSKTGLNSERLVLCVKNDPQAEVIRLQSYGSKLAMELDGGAVSFGKMLLWRKEKRTVTVRNKSNVALYWKLDLSKNPAGTQVTLHPEQGLVESSATSAIECRYYAKSVGTVERTIPFRVFLGQRDAKPLLTDFITIAGETYDVQVDLIDATPLELKNVEVGTMATEKFSLRNRGLFDIEFVQNYHSQICMDRSPRYDNLDALGIVHVLTLPNSIQPEMPADSGRLEFKLPSSLAEDLTLQPSSGSLPAGKSVTIQVNFVPRSELVLRKAPLFKCRLIDTRVAAVTVADIPLLVSVSAHYAKVRIQPGSGLHFGHMAVFEKKTMFFSIENLGCFAFRYKISGPEVFDDMPDLRLTGVDEDTKDRMSTTNETWRGFKTQSKIDKRTTRGGKTTKLAGDRSSVPPRMGPFVLSKDEGNVEPGKFENIAIECCPASVASFERELRVLVPNTGMKGKRGEPFKMSVTGCIPMVDFHDLDAIFKENVIVESLTDFKCPRELGQHSIFARQERCLYIRRVILSRTHTVRLRLRNLGFVFSEVTVTLRTEEATDSNRTTASFSVEPQKSKIAPMSTEIITVSFSPRTLGIHAAMLDIALELPPPLKTPRFNIKLCGEGAVPEVALIEPTTSCDNDQIPIDFGRSLVRETGRRLLSLKNVGFVEARVIVEISTDAGGPFALEADGRGTARSPVRVEMIECLLSPSIECQRRLVRRLLPEEISCLNVTFAPSDVGKYEGHVHVFTADNPYENITLAILGESYIETVVLEGLELGDGIPATSSFSSRKGSRLRKGFGHSQLELPSADSTEFFTHTTIYKLDYGTCFLNEAKRICFKITNKSKTYSFRFEWSSHPSVVFSPTIGHLNKCETKGIVVTFFAGEPIAYTQTQLECRIDEVTGPSEEGNEPSWDNRQGGARWDAGEPSEPFVSKGPINPKERTFEKIEEPTPEPINHCIVPGTMRTLRVGLYAIAAHSRYSCPIREINLKDTFIFQNCRYTFALTNPGIVETSYEWHLAYPNARHLTSQRNSALQEVLRSLDALRGPHSGRTIGASSGTLHPKNDRSPQISRNRSSVADIEQGMRPERLCRADAEALDPFVGTTLSSDGDDVNDSAKAGLVPFKVTPAAGVLQPGECVTCTLVFSPLDVFDYEIFLACRMKNLDPGLVPLKVKVTARSLLPYYHFHLSESDYSRSSKNESDLFGPLGSRMGDPSVDAARVIEFEAVGIGRTLAKKIRMTNPTAEDYHFSWRRCGTTAGRCTKEVSRFDCALAEGIAERGKQTEFTFTFLAKNAGIFESLWIFSIDRYSLETTFLLQAKVMEPSVYLLPGHLTVKPTVVGAVGRSSITIFNQENVQLSFRVMPESPCTKGRVERLVVQPMSGTLHPRSEQRLEIRFRSASVGELEFSVRCCVDKMTNPLVGFVSITTYAKAPTVVYDDTDGRMQPIRQEQNNTIDCENVTLKNDEEQYHSYELHNRITEPGIIGTIDLTAAVRTVVCQWLELENPLRSQPVTYTIECPHPSVMISEASKVVAPQSMERVEVAFNPCTVPFKSVAKLDATCADLGTFSYVLSLKATPALPEKPIHMPAELGTSITFQIALTNFSHQAATFLIATNDPSFSCTESILVAGLGKGTVNIEYEPCELRQVSAMLTATSEIAGDYTFPIIGTAIPPRPRGPFIVTSDRAVSIPFKNVFEGMKTFSFDVSPPGEFYVARSSETIGAKKTVCMNVGLTSRKMMDNGQNVDSPVAAKLTVSTKEAALTDIKWIYYLKGVLD